MSETTPPPGGGARAEPPTVRQLLLLAVPALIIGVGSALVLKLLDVTAEALEHVVWDQLPAALGVGEGARWWIVLILTLTGLAVGLVIWLVPGHAGPDSATTELASSALPLRVLPSIALAVVLSLAGGVSLGPENPIIAINVALAVAVMARLVPKLPPGVAVLLASSATIGALFGTPVAAALVFTGMVAALPSGGELWDRLFAPLVAAGAGAITMDLLGSAGMSFPMPEYDAKLIDLLSGSLIAGAAAAFGLIAVYTLPVVHRLFHSLRNPVLYATLGGLILGLLGAVGGEITMFKGLAQTGELLQTATQYTALGLLGLAAVKIVALVISASAGFRGGRIFPAVFIGVAFGLALQAFFPSVPLPLAVSCGVLGLVLAAARDGWVALFVAVAITGDASLIPPLCLIILPTWLIVARAPKLVVEPSPASVG